MNCMRICIFGSEIGLVKKGVFVGGSTVSAVRLAQTLHDVGDEIFVLSSAPRDKPSGRFLFEWGRIDNRRIYGRYMSLPYLFLYLNFSFFDLLRFCKRNKIDVINTHAGSFLLSAIPGLVGKILHIPVIHTQYCELTIATHSISGLFNRALVLIGSKLPVRFIGISKNVCASLIHAGVPSFKVKFIPPVVPRQTQNMLSNTKYRSSLGFSEQDFIALFVGNLKLNKGLDVLFDAFINLAPEFPNLRLLITTELKHQNFVERKAQLENKIVERGIANKVVWLGFVDNMIDLIRDVDVVVVPFLDLKGISDYPLVVLEAMSVGTPVIATNVGGTPEILNKDTGILIPPCDVMALGKGLRSVITNFSKNRTTSESTLKYFDAKLVGRKYHYLFIHEVTKNERK